MSGAANGAPAKQPAVLGRPRVHLRSTDSTNDRARELAIAGAPHGTLVSASEQTAGRGRQGRRWSAPAGSSLLMSLLLRSPPRLLPLQAAVAVCEVAGADALIKWPNDVVVATERPGGAGGVGLGKLAGILIEARPQEGWAVLGIGLNVAVRLEDLPEELRPNTRRGDPRAGARARGCTPTTTPSALPAASMGGEPGDVEGVLEGLLDALQRRMAEGEELTLEAWRERDALRGREIAWSGGSGRAEGIDGDGRLVVALDGGGHTTVGSGEVHLERIG